MSANPPQSGDPQIPQIPLIPQIPQIPQSHVFRVLDEFHGLTLIAPDTWQQIVQHALPLQPANAAVRLIVITGTVTSTVTSTEMGTVTNYKSICKSIEALQVQTDSFGFLRNWDTTETQSLPPLESPTVPPTVPPTTPPTATPGTPRATLPTQTGKKGRVIDSRQHFMRRYLSHRYSWHPPAPLIAQALLRSGYGDAL